MKDIIEKDFREFFNGVGRKKDYIGDLITIKARDIKNCILYISRLTFKFSPFLDPEYGIIRTRFRTSYYGDYKIPIGESRDFDTLFILGLNRDKKIIEKVFAIPEKELGEKKFITITETGQTYKKFKIDEKPYNKICRCMETGGYSIFEDCNIIIDNKI